MIVHWFLFIRAMPLFRAVEYKLFSYLELLYQGRRVGNSQHTQFFQLLLVTLETCSSYPFFLVASLSEFGVIPPFFQ